jgi:hypothetical protein
MKFFKGFSFSFFGLFVNEENKKLAQFWRKLIFLENFSLGDHY